MMEPVPSYRSVFAGVGVCFLYFTERSLHQEKGCRKASPPTEASPLCDSSRWFQDAPERETCLAAKTQMDFHLENHGSIVLLRPLSASAELWVEENIGADNGYQPYFPTVVIEPRYVQPILNGIIADGLVVA